MYAQWCAVRWRPFADCQLWRQADPIFKLTVWELLICGVLQWTRRKQGPHSTTSIGYMATPEGWLSLLTMWCCVRIVAHEEAIRHHDLVSITFSCLGHAHPPGKWSAVVMWLMSVPLRCDFVVSAGHSHWCCTYLLAYSLICIPWRLLTAEIKSMQFMISLWVTEYQVHCLH